jgi:hypothetical protein
MGRGRAARSGKPDSGHTGTISIAIRVRRVDWNGMKPWIQRVLTPWNRGFIASRSGADLHDQRMPTRMRVPVVLM